jgi:hypothetical protein
VARNATGISLFIRGVDGYAYTERVASGGALQGASWTRMANQYVVGAPTGTWSPDGKALMVAVVGADYSIYLRRQSGGTWGDWRREPGNGGAYAATVGLADRGDALALFVRGSNGNAYIESLKSTGALTSTWRAFDMQVMGAPSASFNPERTAAAVIAVGTDNRILEPGRQHARPGVGRRRRRRPAPPVPADPWPAATARLPAHRDRRERHRDARLLHPPGPS